MLTLDVSGALAKAITPSFGVPEQELTALRTSMRRYIGDWLEERRKGEHSWSMAPYDKVVIDQVKGCAKRLKAERIRTVVWIGIGGSGLGPKVIQEVFENPETMEFILIDTIDPAVLQVACDMIDWRHAAIVVVSKSGETLETMSAFFLCYERLVQAKAEKAASRVVAITDPAEGALRKFALDHAIEMLPIPSGIGGRYCIFTPVGLLPLALLDGDIDAFVRGAKEMDTLCQQMLLEENPAAMLASIQYILDAKKGYAVRVIMPYMQRLQSFSRWNQQLIAESLGKKETANPIPLAAIGTQDQHSLLQQWLAGPRKCWHIFIRDEEKPRLCVPERVPKGFQHLAGKTFGQLLEACYEGTSRALTANKRPHVTISMTRLDAQHLGQLFFCLLAEVVMLGKLYRLDPYGQPAVELGKKFTKDILARGHPDL
jgi:glucose-6-phosphate isomerase